MFFKSGQALLELSKDKPNMKQVEGNTTSFLKTLESVEQGLTKQISYLTQVSTGKFVYLSLLGICFLFSNVNEHVGMIC